MTDASDTAHPAAPHTRHDLSLLRLCPHCGSNDNYRSHRKMWEYFLFSLKPYRCKMCKRRFYSTISSHDLHL